MYIILWSKWSCYLSSCDDNTLNLIFWYSIATFFVVISIVSHFFFAHILLLLFTHIHFKCIKMADIFHFLPFRCRSVLDIFQFDIFHAIEWINFLIKSMISIFFYVFLPAIHKYLHKKLYENYVVVNTFSIESHWMCVLVYVMPARIFSSFS